MEKKNKVGDVFRRIQNRFARIGGIEENELVIPSVNKWAQDEDCIQELKAELQAAFAASDDEYMVVTKEKFFAGKDL